MAFSTNDLKNGMTLDLDDGLFQVIEFQHVKPGKGGAFVRTKLRNSRTGAVLERTFRAGEKVEQAIVDKREMQYLYPEGTDHVFMDNSSYDQMHVTDAALGDATGYLLPGSNILMMVYKDEIIGTELPSAVDLTVTQTEPGVQGDRSSAGRKPATVETGKVVQVPLFVNQGDKIRVDTRTGEYVTRVT
jgi:elongation factor P